MALSKPVSRTIKPVHSQIDGIGYVASKLLEILSRDLSTKEFILGISGGRSVHGLGQALCDGAETFRHARLDRLVICQTDTYSADDSRPESNWDVIQEQVIGPLVAANLFNATSAYKWDFTGDIEADLRHYNGLLHSFRRNAFDAAILGIGGGTFPDGTEDCGHIAGIFAGEERAYDVLDPFLSVNGAKKPPNCRLTMSVEHIKGLRWVWGLLFGEEKKNVVGHLEDTDGAVTPLQCPAMHILKHRGGLIVSDQV